METLDIYAKILAILNGPIILITSLVGIILNIVTIYILSLIVSAHTDMPTPYTPIRSKNSIKYKNEIYKTSKTTRKLNPLEVKLSGKRRKRPRIFIYFLWLTGCDIFLLCCSIFNFSIPTLLYDLPNLYMKAIPFWYTLSNSSFTASVWLMIALIIDRYCSLCRRFKNIVIAQRIESKKIHFILATISIASLLYSLPRFFELSIDYNKNHDVYLISTTSLFDNWIYMVVYRVIGSLIFYSVLPYILTFIIISKFWIVLKASLESQHSLNVIQSKSTNPIESDKLLIALAIKFLISRLPTTLIDIYEILKGSYEFFNSSMAMYFVYVSNFLVIFSSASSFFMFLMFSSKFQQYVFRLCKIFK